MNKEQVIKNTEEFVKAKLLGEGSGHDWWHIKRVRDLAKNIAKSENVDTFVVELAALLHDIADWKSNQGDTEIGSRTAKEWLEQIGVEKNVTDQVTEIIKNLSFLGSENIKKPKTKEGEIVQDADRLDAIGAIGIARGFMFAGKRGLPMYDPDIKPVENMKAEQYKDLSRKSYTQINHFYEKLFLLKDLMNTKTAKKIAVDRDKFMREYLNEFYSEWEGKA